MTTNDNSRWPDYTRRQLWVISGGACSTKQPIPAYLGGIHTPDVGQEKNPASR